MSDYLNEAKKLAESHPEQVDKAVEGAGKEAEQRTGDKYDKQIDEGVQDVEKHLGKQ